MAALGAAQTDIEDRFAALLDQVRSGKSACHVRAACCVGGGFGAGKSHLLEHLAQLALQIDFVVSRVVISKETPLHDPVKVFRAAAEAPLLPHGRAGRRWPRQRPRWTLTALPGSSCAAG